MAQKKYALQLIEASLKELESSKGSVLTAIQKLQRASSIIGNEDVNHWCSIQLGDIKFTIPLQEFLDFIATHTDTNTSEYKRGMDPHIKKLEKLGLDLDVHFSHEEMIIKNDSNGGGYGNIGFIEERYNDLVRAKNGNDGTYYKINLNDHINYVKKKAHSFASEIFKQLKFEGTVSSCFVLLKDAVDDKLLDLNPVIAEQLMLAFKSVSSDKEEEWSQSLSTCRRLLEGVADELYPASKEKYNGRPVGQAQYINRLWAFMDKSIQSDSNKELAKSHVDFLGSWMEKTNKITNKGVHADLEKLEAVKSVFHTYLVVGDILSYLEKKPISNNKPSINTATIDEIEALLNVKRETAKEIIKARVKEGRLDLDTLKQVKGVGPKTLRKIDVMFEM